MSSPALPHAERRLPSLRSALFAVLVGTLLAFAATVVEDALVDNRARTLLTATLSARQLADAGVRKAVYCLNATSGLNCGGSFGERYIGESQVSLGGGTYTTTVTAESETSRHVESVGETADGWPHVTTARASSEPPHQSIAFPEPADGALPDFNPDFWRNAAAAGGTHDGDLTVSADGILGPTKINGDLTVGRGVNVIISGPVWVTGNFTLEPDSFLSVSKTFGQYGTVVLVDDPDQQAGGRVVIKDGASVGNAEEVTTGRVLIAAFGADKDAETPAVSVGDLDGNSLILAARGTLLATGRLRADAVAAVRLSVSPSAVIDANSDGYSADLAASPIGLWKLKL